MTISNVSISPAIAAAGDVIHVSCKVTMGSGFYENAREINFYLGNGEGSHWFHSTDWTEQGFYLAAGKSRTFTIVQNMGSEPLFARGDRLVLSVVAITGSESDTGTREATYEGAGMTWLEAWREPSIASLSARRFLNGAPSPIGTQAAVSLQAALKPGAASGGMACTLSWRKVGDAEYSQPVSVPVAGALSGIAEDTALLSALQMELGSEYDVLAYFGDEFESAKQRFRIAKAHTKFSVAKNAPGVSVGQHSTASPESPKFECQYPAHFYGGITALSHAHILEMLGVQTGVTGFPSGVPQGWKDVAITFPIPYKQPPLILIFPQTGNITAANVGSNLLVLLQDTLTATGFTVRWYNDTTATRYPGARWIAIGELDN